MLPLFHTSGFAQNGNLVTSIGYPPMGYIFVICLKVLPCVIWTFTSTPQLKLMMVHCVLPM